MIWKHERAPTAGELPAILFRAAAFGALAGPTGAILFYPIFYQSWPNWGGHVLRSTLECMYIGACFSLSFFVCGSLPWPYLRHSIKDWPIRWRRPLIAAIGATGCMLGLTMTLALLRLVPQVTTMSFLFDHYATFLFIEAVLGACIALIIGTIKALQFQLRVKELHEAALREAAAKAQAAALQAQINPHFFFNTLNTLAALIPLNPAAAQEIVGRLADMFRYTLACSCAEQVTLAQELAFVENYLKLEQARFSSRLRVALPEGRFEDIRLPGLSLQPLVENAIRYGIGQRIEGGAVEIAVHRNGGNCSVDVFSPVEGDLDPARFFREGHALANIRDRLRLHNGDEASVDVAREGNDRVRVSLVLPTGVC